MSNTFVCIFFNFYDSRCIVGIYIFLWIFYLFIVFGSTGRCSLQCVCGIFLSPVFDGFNHVFSFVYELLINALAIYLFFHKFIKSNNLNMISKMERRLFARDHSTQTIIRHISYNLSQKEVGEGGGGGSELESRADTFKNYFRT